MYHPLGGVYNPIIPVFRAAPAAWRPRHPELVSGFAIARGYADFFEPDIYVEATPGLLEKAGLGSLRGKSMLHDRIIGLDDLLVQHENHTYAEPAVGLSVMDVLRHAFATEQRFQLRDPRAAVVMTPSASSPFVEAMFGGYPTGEPCSYIAKGFEDVYRPEHLEATPDTWLKIVGTRAMTPLGATRTGLKANRTWQHDLLVFVFDPSKTVDLIDLWNLRLEPRPVLPVPLPWFAELADAVHERLLAEHRPLQGNPNGVMHQGTVEFGRSISEDRAMAAMALLKKLPKGAAPAKLWRTPIWEPKPDSRIYRDERLEITAKERRTSVEIRRRDGASLPASKR